VRDGRSKNGGSLNAKRHIAIVTKLWPALGEVSATTGSTVRLKKTRRHMAAHGGTRRNTAEHDGTRQITADHGRSRQITEALCGFRRLSAELGNTRLTMAHDFTAAHGESRRLSADHGGSRRLTGLDLMKQQRRLITTTQRRASYPQRAAKRRAGDREQDPEQS
jgi:hypothetical protein